MTVLGDLVHLTAGFRRSVHVERDAGHPLGEAYIPTARALHTLRRITEAMLDNTRGRAWSITGPYGTGKSSFALFVDALLGPPGPVREVTTNALAAADIDLCHRLEAGRARLHHSGEFTRAVATSRREPVTTTIIRALRQGAERRWSTDKPIEIARSLRQAEQAGDVGAVLKCVGRLSDHGPVVILIDEFGKNLEYLADDPAGGDLFVLQELAEQASGDPAHPLFLITLQHLAYADYATAAALRPAARREWGKVQGRFEDIAFLDGAEQAGRVIAAALDPSAVPIPLQRRIRSWAGRSETALTQLGLPASEPDLVTACYPLHPTVTLILPELCARYGQHERTLAGFVASGDVGSVAHFMARATVPARGPLPAVRLPEVYAYFVGSSSLGPLGNDTSRWTEVATRLGEVHGLDDVDQQIVQAVGVLNLVAAGGALRASPALLALALFDTPDPSPELLSRLADLEQRGLITYRAFADEYRLWQGSDFDLGGQLAAARDRLSALPLVDLLARSLPLPAVVAARHSQRVGILRYFDRAFVDPARGWPPIPASADGLVAYLLEASDALPPAGSKPVVAAVVDDPGPLAAAALEAAICAETLTAAAGDIVARREMEERLAVASRAARGAADQLFRPGQDGVTWRVVGAGHVQPSPATLSRLLSDVCDSAYTKSPELRTETLARRELTSQGAKARRTLLEAMVDHTSREKLAIEGYGPERAMYEAMLHHPGIHRARSGGIWSFGPPKRNSSLAPAWAALEQLLLTAQVDPVGAGAVHRLLSSAPFGIPQGPIPVLLVAMLMAHSDELAIYFDGTYQPHLTTEMVERLTKAPDRFTFKSFAVTGLRADVIGKLITALGSRVHPTTGATRRNPTLLEAVAPLIGILREQPEYALRTALLSTSAIAVREALRSARQPDQLLFHELPTACGMRLPVGQRKAAHELATRFVERLTTALEELEQAYPRLLEGAEATVTAAFQLPEDLEEARSDLRARARRLEGSVLDPRLRSFIAVATNTDHDDESWLEALLLTAGGKPPKTWRDDDRRRFELTITELAGLLRRVEALHFESLADDGGDGFDARRITVTAPTGEETSAVVWVDHSTMASATETARRALDDLQGLLGSRALPALFAVFAGWAADTQPGAATHDPSPEQEERRA